jgi:acyl carrier protein
MRRLGLKSEAMKVKEISNTVKDYILREFLPGENPQELTDSTPLIAGGILDSIALIKLIAFLEETYNVQIEAHEIDMKYLSTISDIVSFVRSKL